MYTKPTTKITGYLASNSRKALFIVKQGQRNTLIAMDYGPKGDKFTVGSGFYGKIYTSRCDLSPDGRYFIYFARGNKPFTDGKGRKYSCWNGICRPPSITAELFLPCDDSWGGGAYFYGTDGKNIFITKPMYPGYEPHSIKSFGAYQISFNPEAPQAAYLKGELFYNRQWETMSKNDQGHAVAFKRASKKVSLILTQKYSLGEDYGQFGEFDSCLYEISLNKTGFKLFDWDRSVTWADLDNDGRLIVAKDDTLLFYNNARAIRENDPEVINLAEKIESSR